MAIKLVFETIKQYSIFFLNRTSKTKCILFYAVIVASVSSILITLLPIMIQDVKINCPG